MLKKRVYSTYARDAAALLGRLIQLARKEKKMTAQDLADRADIARGTLRKIEQGNLSCELGIVFEIAALVGVKLFDIDQPVLGKELDAIRNKITLLPQSIRKSRRDIDDDF
ncbi:MAG: helix-turn-helix transcriptional regulator [Gammaproteobacteria bacterium]|nr:helix-turn-helix transcriptional regulator [Gammaproteobacteria bacterium]